MTVRTRIAPSPTGDPHVGTAFIALFNYAFAKSHGGQFILRIEDTDQARSSDASEQAILDALKWIGLSWDEGPDVGGDFGPYRQSERAEIYQKHTDQLVQAGHAFTCFCTQDELALMRSEQMSRGESPRYDGCCSGLDADTVSSRLGQGQPHVIRMRVPDEGDCEFVDRLRGKITIPWSNVDMQVLMKGDGLPTYHLANVVDDHLMGITHVIRGEEWIPSAPKHQLLYQYFGWEMPELCHLPLLRNPDQSKLSKRKNPTSILFYRDQGFLPESLLNYLGRMGWSMPDESERFTLNDMISSFNLDRVSLGGPIFDVEKLTWLNGQWLKLGISDEDYITRLMRWGFGRSFFESVLPHLKTRIEVFSEASEWLNPLWIGAPDLDKSALSDLGLDNEILTELLQYLVWRLDAVKEWDRATLESAIRWAGDALGLKLKQIMPVVFVVLSGKRRAMSAFDLAELLGADRTRARFRTALDVSGGVSKKGLKRLEKRYQEAINASEGGL
ncbi:glutamate--tRNA ligase [Litorivicinus sp.]|nr:glutamate--tRNA ligase [Litorivicinus sp.]MDC1466726.1 glutamate--tRNA ligase [Litorivicinus sp.]